jgi:hypothetical protein
VLGTTALPNASADEWDNESDLIGALLVATNGTHDHLVHQLIVASDGLIVSGELAINCERTVPTAKEVLARLKRRHVALDLSPFQAITICGFSNEGLTAAAMQAREALWRGLIAAGKGPAPLIVPSCRDLGRLP